MNIFYLDSCPIQSAKMLCNKHIVKMGLESVQMLATILPQDIAPVKHTHVNHPSTIWCRQSFAQYKWLMEHAAAIFVDYSRRYLKRHKTELDFFTIKRIIDAKVDSGDINRLFPSCNLFTQPPQCMPDEYKHASSIEAYRNYYWGDKQYFARWMSQDEIPHWWPEKSIEYVRRSK